MILITGGGGFIGLHIARELVDQGRDVLLVRRHSFEVPSFLSPNLDKGVKVVLGDIGDLPFLYGVLREHNVESIIHAAALHESTGSLYETIKVNLQGTADILEAARIFSLRRVTFFSSVTVYFPANTAQSLEEDMDLPVVPPNYISGTKRAGEQICQLYTKQHGLSVPIIRPPLVWGPLYKSGRNPLQAMVESAVSGSPVDLSHLDGSAKRLFIYARDCAKATRLIHLAPSLEHAIYNVSNGESLCLEDFATAIKTEIPGTKIELAKGPRDGEGTGLEMPPLNIERIRSEFGFSPDYDVHRGVKAYIDWVRDGNYH